MKVVTDRREIWGEGVKVISRFHERLACNMKGRIPVNLDCSYTGLHRPYGAVRLTLPDFQTIGKVVSPTHRQSLPP